MRITVIYTTQLRAELGLGQETIDVAAPCSVSQLVKQLAAKHHLAFSRLAVSSDGKLLPSIMLCLNDQQIVATKDQQLSDGDTLTFLSAISGG